MLEQSVDVGLKPEETDFTRTMCLKRLPSVQMLRECIAVPHDDEVFCSRSKDDRGNITSGNRGAKHAGRHDPYTRCLSYPQHELEHPLTIPTNINLFLTSGTRLARRRR